jgi:26S proteasome regulatory subunit N5
MDKREKTDFILDQVRLLIAIKDLTRAQIMSRKISTRYFEDKETKDLKIRYLNLMIHLAKMKKEYFEVCKHYKTLFDTVSEDKLEMETVLKFVVVFAVLAPYDNHQVDMVHTISQIPHLEKISLYKYSVLIKAIPASFHSK